MLPKKQKMCSAKYFAGNLAYYEDTAFNFHELHLLSLFADIIVFPKLHFVN